MELKSIVSSILEGLQDPSLDFVPPEVWVTKILQSIPNDQVIQKQICGALGCRIQQLDFKSESFESDFLGLWDAFQNVKKVFVEHVPTILQIFELILLYYAKRFYINLERGNNPINVADIQSAIANINQTDVIQNALLQQQLRASGLLSESTLKQHLMEQRSDIVSTSSRLMGGTCSNPGLSRENITMKSLTELGMSVSNILNFARVFTTNSSKEIIDETISSISIPEMIQWVSFNHENVYSEIGNGSVTAYYAIAKYQDKVILLLRDIMRLKLDYVELLPLYKHVANRLSGSDIVSTLNRLTIYEIMAYVETIYFGHSNRLTIRTMSTCANKLLSQENIPFQKNDMDIDRLFNEIYTDLCQFEPSFPSKTNAQVNVTYDEYVASTSQKPSSLDITIDNMISDLDSLREQVESVVEFTMVPKEKIVKLIQENHIQIIKECYRRNVDSVKHLLCEQCILTNQLTTVDGFHRIKSLYSIDLEKSKGVLMVENAAVDNITIEEMVKEDYESICGSINYKLDKINI